MPSGITKDPRWSHPVEADYRIPPASTPRKRRRETCKSENINEDDLDSGQDAQRGLNDTHWQLVNTGDAVAYHVKARHSGKCRDVRGSDGRDPET
jgi:hypothetical protein